MSRLSPVCNKAGHPTIPRRGGPSHAPPFLPIRAVRPCFPPLSIHAVFLTPPPSNLSLQDLPLVLVSTGVRAFVPAHPTPVKGGVTKQQQPTCSSTDLARCLSLPLFLLAGNRAPLPGRPLRYAAILGQLPAGALNPCP
ncbi:hypothetical protein LIA77_10157 [Sarocladium implicatum]|nr:hypothetical protein LIA77_10157 [Sarocladium implicatum]